MTFDEDPDDTGSLTGLRQELAARGIVIDDPAEGGPVYFHGTRSCHCELGLRRTGEVTWTFVPQAGPLNAAAAVRMTLALLAPDAVPPPAREPPPRDEAGGTLAAAGRVLDGAGMTAEPVRVSYADGSGEFPALVVVSPAVPARGLVRITADPEFVWEFRFACPGSPAPGLSPAEVALAIAAALSNPPGETR